MLGLAKRLGFTDSSSDERPAERTVRRDLRVECPAWRLDRLQAVLPERRRLVTSLHLAL